MIGSVFWVQLLMLRA